VSGFRVFSVFRGSAFFRKMALAMFSFLIQVKNLKRDGASIPQ